MSKLFVILLCVYWAQAEKVPSLIARDTRVTSDFLNLMPPSFTISHNTYPCPGGGSLYLDDATFNMQTPTCLTEFCASSQNGIFTASATIWYTAVTSKVNHQYWNSQGSCGGILIRQGDDCPASIIVSQNSGNSEEFIENGCDTTHSYGSVTASNNVICVNNTGNQLMGSDQDAMIDQVSDCFLYWRAQEMASCITSGMTPSKFNENMSQSFKQ